MRHELKTWVGPFAATIQGHKKFEIRKEIDRSFAERDCLVLREWDEVEKRYTGRAVETTISHIVRGPEWDIPHGMAILSLSDTSDVFDDTYPGDDPSVTRDLLLLVSVDVSLLTISEWSQSERKQAEEWASAAMLQASDNDVVVGPVPLHVSLWT